MTDQQISPNQLPNDDSANALSIHDIIQMVLSNWYWFVLSVLVCLGVAYYHLAKTPNVYSRSATILVKDSRKGGEQELAAFTDLIGFQNQRSVDNEIYILQSRRLMTEVVKNLNLTTSYTVSEGLRDKDLYGQSPIDVKFINDNDNQYLKLEITPQSDDEITLSNFEDGLDSKTGVQRVITAQYGDSISTPIGELIVSKTLYMNASFTKAPITVTKRPLNTTTNIYREKVKCNVANKQASVVLITMNCNVPKRAEDVINTLISEYNDDAINDQRRISVLTAEFIKSRLDIIGKELGSVDENIESFKKDNKMVDFISEATRNLAESSQYKNESLSIDNQINVAEFIRSYLTDTNTAGELIPSMASISNNGISDQITIYNEVVLRREKLRENSSDTNPVIRDMDSNLAAVRRSIVASLDSYISTLEIQRNALRKEEQLSNSKISTAPSQERIILGIARQQKIKEELFLYLLSKQEENQLNYAVAESSARTIDLAYGSSTPILPHKLMILGIAMLVGIAIPSALLYLEGMLDTTVRGRKDIEDKLTIPFLGEIPLYNNSESSDLVVVRETGRDALSEAFRMLRTNMSFMNLSGKEMQVILFTSSNPHAGKTFIAANLAMTLAMTGKKVLLLDLDLRRHTLSSLLGHGNSNMGITNYLTEKGRDLKDFIAHTEFNENLDIIYAGIQPPNPTEILLSQRLSEIISELRSTYDYILIDSTPAMSIADAYITDRLADLCIYVIREGILDRRQLPDIERQHKEKKFHNMSIVLNGTHRYGYGYNYGYSYGYNYGYNYGYGYDEKPLEVSYRKRILTALQKLAGKIRNRA